MKWGMEGDAVTEAARGRKAALECTQTPRLTLLRGGASAPGNTPGGGVEG